MPHTIELLEKALTMKKAAQWSHDFNITRATITNAKKRGRLSPTLAGIFAMELGADPIFWTAVAAAEAEPPGPLRDRLERSLERQKTVLSGRSDDAEKTSIVPCFNSDFRAPNTTVRDGKRAVLRCRRRWPARREEYQLPRGARLRSVRAWSGLAVCPTSHLLTWRHGCPQLCAG